jgi:hypothetical protein
MMRNKLRGFTVGVVSPLPNHQAGGPSPVGCPQLLIQFFRNYPPYLEAVSSTRNLRTLHAVVTGDLLKMVQFQLGTAIISENLVSPFILIKRTEINSFLSLRSISQFSDIPAISICSRHGLFRILRL